MYSAFFSQQSIFIMPQIGLTLLSSLLLLFACERPNSCETGVPLQGEALRFYYLTPTQIDSFQVLQPQGPTVLTDAEAFQAWVQIHAPDLVGEIDFAQEAVLLAGTNAIGVPTPTFCDLCTFTEVAFHERRRSISIEETIVIGNCDDFEFRSPQGLLVIRRPPFEVENVSVSIKQKGA
jgi:hypothetical protein